MKRVYGYMKRKGTGKRWQDGLDAQLRSESTPVIDQTVLVADHEDVIEINVKSAPQPVIVPEPTKAVEAPVETEETEEESDETGELPEHLTPFMSLDSVQPDQAVAAEEPDPDAE